VIDQAHQVLCEAGVGIASLAKEMRLFKRESHSVLGSVFLNPTVAAGVAFGSGGTQLRKGPAYTERALYCRVDEDRRVLLVNELGLEGLPDGTVPYDSAEGKALLARVDAIFRGDGGELRTDAACVSPASDREYGARMARMDGDISRFNADTRGPAVNRCEGKVLILATVHDTYEPPQSKTTLWVSTDSAERAFELKRFLFGAQREAEARGDSSIFLPASIEYMNRDAVDAIDEAARLYILVIGLLGVDNPLLKPLFETKSAFERLPMMSAVPDTLLCAFNGLLPPPLPEGVRDACAAYDHHLLIDLGEYGGGEASALRQRLDDFAAAAAETVATPPVRIHEATSAGEAKTLSLFRFVAAAAFKVWCTGHGAKGLSLDYALPTDVGGVPPIPLTPVKRLRYSHFGCNVVHDDIALPSTFDEARIHAIKGEIKAGIENMGGRLPSEHGHGTEYEAPADTKRRWMEMDPTNSLNPGIGGLSPLPNYGDS